MTGRLTLRGAVLTSLAAVTSAVLFPAAARAQRNADDRRAASVVAAAGLVAPRRESEELDLEGTPVLVVNGAPRSFQVVTVPIPIELGVDHTVTYDVTAMSSAPVLGRRSGKLVGRRPSDRVVTLTVGIPAVALAGRTTIAFVRFSADGLRSVRVPVDLEVPAIPRVRITPAQELRGARPGEQFEIWFDVMNAGNQRDTIDLRVDGPPTWSARLTAPGRMVMQPGETITRSVRMMVPTASDIGDFPVTLVAHAGLIERARAVTVIEVTDMARTSRRAGPVVTVGVATATSDGISARPIETIAVDGPISDGVTVSARLSTPLPADAILNRALATMGYSSNSNFVSIAAPRWGATLGTTGFSLNDVAGQSVFGRGASLQLNSEHAQVKVLGATPLSANAGTFGEPSLFAATTGVRVGSGLITGFLAHLRDSTYMVRALDVVGIGGEVRPWRRGTISAQVAERKYDDGNGIGAAGHVRGPVAGGDIDLRIVHAPGGTAAFASTRDALSASAARVFGRLRTDASYWGTQDRTATAANVGSSGWSFSPTYALLAPFTIGADIRHTEFSSTDANGEFGSSQQEYGGRAHLMLRGFDLSADSRWSTVTSSAAAGGAQFNDQLERVTSRGRLDHLGARGDVGIGASIETATIGRSAVPAPTTFDVHAERLQILPWMPGLTANAAWQRMQYGQAVLTTSRGELSLEVKRSIRIVFGGERGTIRDARGVIRSVMTLRVERTTFLPAFDRRVMAGVVYQDRNGNSVRDPGEPGVAGIVVHRGSESAVSDAKGVFRLGRESSGRIEIESRSLPDGWLQSPRLLDGTADSLELGVIPTTALEIRITLAPLPDGTAPNVRLGEATLVLHDSAGREWIAQSSPSSRATFDALPAGRYSLVVELNNSSEPLIVDSIPTIEIGGVPGRKHVTVVARTRPVRIFRPRTPAAPRT